jgi:hypothetical protein
MLASMDTMASSTARIGVLVLLVLTLAFPAAVSGDTQTGPQSGQLRASTASSSQLRVTEVEYRLLLSSGVIKAGPVDLEAIDRGMDPHDLHLQHAGSSAAVASPLLASGRHWSDVMDLRPGVYKMWCSLPEHARLGMRATLHVIP